LRAINEAAAAGNAPVRAKDEPALANLDQRAAQMRAELREMERTYTASYMAREPKAVEARKRLADLEAQIKAQREESQKAALADARQELASAKGAVARIDEQIASSRGEVGQFTMRFNEYKARQEQLADLEKALRESVQKRATIEASERARMPGIKIIEAASAPQQPWRPLYWRDTGISIGGSLLLALLMMGLVELFNRSGQQPTMVLVPPQPTGLTLEGGLAALPGQQVPLAALQRSEPRLLAQQPKLPRELSRDEVAALVQAFDAGNRLVALLLLSGLTADEAIALRAGDVDLARGVLRVGGESGRGIAISDSLRAELAARTTSAASDSLLSQNDRSVSHEGIDAQILCAAHDAGLEDPASVNADCLRHTYVAYLVRQGIRFADLTSLVGDLPADVLGAYTGFAPPGARVARERIETSYPSARANVAG
jgi:integrase